MLAEPVETFIESITTDGTSALDEPSAATDGMKSKFVSDLWAGHSTGKVLLVGKDKEYCVFQLLLGQHLMKLLTVLINSLTIVAVDDKDQTLSVLVVVAPE